MLCIFYYYALFWSTVIEVLDGMKKGRENYTAREAIKFLEREFQKGNKFIRAQKSAESLNPGRKKGSKLDAQVWYVEWKQNYRYVERVLSLLVYIDITNSHRLIICMAWYRSYHSQKVHDYGYHTLVWLTQWIEIRLHVVLSKIHFCEKNRSYQILWVNTVYIWNQFSIQ